MATYLPIVEATPDLTYELVPNSCKVSEVFDPVPSLIAADWHMRNPHKNYGLLTPKALFYLVQVGWLTLAQLQRYKSVRTLALASLSLPCPRSTTTSQIQ